MATDITRMDIIRQLMEASPKSNGRLDHIYFTYLKAVGGHYGLQNKLLKRPKLQRRVKKVYKHRDALDALKTCPDNSTWFRLSDRPAILTDSLGIYSVAVSSSLLITEVTDVKAARLIQEILGSPHAWSK